jgi:glycosyltransferase involved in cell wall biosynthesis
MTDKKRVMLVARNLRVGGIERNTVNLANTLTELGHEAHIVILKDRQELVPDKGVKVHVFDLDGANRRTGIGLLYDLVTRWFLATAIRGSGFVWRGLYGGFFFRRMLRRLEKQYGRFDKIIMRGQGAFEHVWSFNDPRVYQVVVSPVKPSPGRMRDRWYSRLLYGNKNMVANSSDVLETLERRMSDDGVSAASVSMIFNPCPIARIQQMAEEPAPVPGEPYIVHVARLCPQKNQTLLLQAYQQANIREKLYIIGTGKDEAKLRKLAQTLGIAERVVFLDQQMNPYPWMKHAEMFVLTSVVEGFGLVLVESLACGTQVVAADCPGGVRHVLVEEQRRLVAEQNPESLAEKIHEALENPVTIKPEWYQRFDATVVARQFLDLP